MVDRLDSILRRMPKQPRRFSSRELADERPAKIYTLSDFEDGRRLALQQGQQPRCPKCGSTECDSTGCRNCGTVWFVLEHIEDQEYRTFQGEDEANAKKMRVEASRDGHEATGRVGGALNNVSAMVEREAGQRRVLRIARN